MGFDHSGNNPDDCGLSDASPCRAVPDVSGDADPRNSLLVFGVACGLSKDQSYAGWEGFGGTSFASPQWAALAALIDEGIPGSRAGLLSPALYAVARTDPSAFIDVMQGNNDSLTNNNSFGIDMGDYPVVPLSSNLATWPPPATTRPPAWAYLSARCWPPISNRSMAESAPTSARWVVPISTLRLSAWHPPPTGIGTGWSLPTAASSASRDGPCSGRPLRPCWPRVRDVR